MKKYQELLKQLEIVCEEYPFGSHGYDILQKTISMIKERIEIGVFKKED